MNDRILIAAALVLGAAPLAAQAPAPSKGGTPPQRTIQYVPAIMQPRQVTLAGCLQQKEAFILTDATVPAQNEKGEAQPAPASTYRIEGLSSARLSMVVGKRVTVTGAYQQPDATKGGEAGDAAALPRFEATNVNEAEEGSCSSAG